MPARTYLPANLPSNPSYRKVNPADSPIMVISLTSDKYPVTKLYDLASTILEQKLSQIQGVGQVGAQGGGTPSVRVEVNPTKLESFGSPSQRAVGTQLQNSHLPRGQLADKRRQRRHPHQRPDLHAADYRPLIVGYHNGNAIKLSDVADVEDSTQNIRTAGYIDGTRGVVLTIFRQPGRTLLRPSIAPREADVSRKLCCLRHPTDHRGSWIDHEPSQLRKHVDCAHADRRSQ